MKIPKLLKSILAFLMALTMLLSMCVPAWAATKDTDPYSCNHPSLVIAYYSPEPTCTEPGQGVLKCTVCGSLVNEKEIPPLGHAWGGWKTTKEPTCTAEGQQQNTCSRCGLTQTQSLAPLGHSFGKWKVDIEPTCEHWGKQSSTCWRCGLAQTASIKPLGHDWGDWYLIKAPTPQEDGMEERACQRCGITEQRPVPYVPGTVYPDPDPDPVPAPIPVPDPVPDPIPAAPELVLSMIQTTPAKEGGFAFTDKIGYNWTLTNVGSAPCLYYALNCDINGAFHGAVDIGQEGLTLAPYGGSTGGSFTLDAGADCAPGATSTLHLFVGVGMTMEGDNFVYSNKADFAHQLTDKLPPWDIPSEASISVEKTVISHSALPEGYQVNETVEYQITVTNTGNVPLSGVEAYDVPGGISATLLGTIPYLDPGQSAFFNFSLPVTAEMIGTVIGNEACVIWDDPVDGEENTTWSNWVDVPTTKKTGGLTITKAVTSTPPHDGFYWPGDVVNYSLTITNNSDKTYSSGSVYDPLIDKYIPMAVLGEMAPGFTTSVSLTYKVTDSDAFVGYVYNIAYIEAPYVENGISYLNSVDSNPVVVAVTFEGDPPTPTAGELTIIKKENSFPADLCAYKPNETVNYQVTVRNDTETPHTDVVIYDTLLSYTILVGQLQPGEEKTFYYGHIVTEPEGMTGTLINTATVISLDIYGASHSSSSSEIVPTAWDIPIGIEFFYDVSIVKTETSTPKDGSAYQLGETITYTVTVTNTGDSKIDEAVIFDYLNSELPKELGAIENFFPGTSRTFTYSHEVDASDVQNKHVTNYAEAEYYTSEFTYPLYKLSNLVDSKVGEGEPDSKKDLIDTEPLRNGDLVPCMRTLQGAGEGNSEFVLHICGEHLPILEKARTAAPAEARKLWQDAINEMYAACQAAATTPQAQLAVLNEKALFYAQMNAFEAALKLSFSAEDVEARTQEALMDHCADLCCMIHTAPLARADSLLGGHETLSSAAACEACGKTVLEEKNADILYSEVLCDDHRLAETSVLALLGKAKGPQAQRAAFKQAQAIWQSELNALTNDRYLAAEKENRPLIAADRKTFDGWTSAYETFLNLLYPSGNETAEIISKTIMNRLMNDCAAAGK